MNCMSHVFLDIKPLSNICFGNIFCQSVKCHLILLMFLCLEFDVVPLVCFCSSCLWFWCETQKLVAKTNGKKITSMYSSRGLNAWGLMFTFYSLFSRFLCMVKDGHSFIFSQDYPVFPVPFCKACPFPTGYSWLRFHKLTDNIRMCLSFRLRCSALLIYVSVFVPEANHSVLITIAF